MISKKTRNAIEVCVYLASQKEAGYVTTSELSPQLGLSVSHLENILKPLKDRHVVCAMKGPGGGYMIDGDVSMVSIWDIASVFEKTQADSAAVHADYERGLEDIVKNTLSSFTLSDFVNAYALSAKHPSSDIGRFKFKPLAAPFMPKAPNSVFQLHMSF
jgi:Rrf2 family protein